MTVMHYCFCMCSVQARISAGVHCMPMRQPDTHGSFESAFEQKPVSHVERKRATEDLLTCGRASRVRGAR
jgi:hypothetical protein